MDASVLNKKPVGELKEIAEALQLKGYKSLRKADLIELIISGGGQGIGDAESSSDTESSSSVESSSAESSSAESSSAEASSAVEASADTESRTTEASTEASAEASPEPELLTSADRVRARRRMAVAGETETARPARARIREERPRPTEAPRERDDRGPGDDGDGDRGEARSRNRSRNRNKRPRHDDSINFDELEVRSGVLDLLPEGYGFLRTTGYLSGERDVYVSQAFVRRNQLRRGDLVAGPIRYNKGNDKFPALARIDAIEGTAMGQDARPEPRPDFKDLTPVFPDQRLTLEAGPDSPASMRLIDLLAPIGKGQRGLVVSPSRAGKTTILRQLAAAIEHNHPDVQLMVLLVDERPEEVTEFERVTKAEVIASTFDRPAEDHAQIAELAVERAKRIVERGGDVVILLDSLTRLGRAHSLIAPPVGRVLAEGLDSTAINPPKRFFGAARNVEEGGSLTIVAVAEVDTASALDEAIFAEFIGTCNMELHLDAKLARKRLYPAIDVIASETRGDDKLLPPATAKAVNALRRQLASMEPESALAALLDKVEATESNDQLLEAINDGGL